MRMREVKIVRYAGLPVCPPRSPREPSPRTTHSSSRVAASGPLPGARGVPMSGAIAGPVPPGHPGWRRVRRNGVGSERERRVVESFSLAVGENLKN